ncbi:hypothetical protein COCNU_07G010330 [Cocos nucifera]|uniref:Uncharacterized protein n=1 Tax=Cocos nucifera TaxID=13894 RepID=A0A8K0N585_COCNU|nr:hypothetical protein COCNU_07G010330 [Cocos nucifera]
MSTEEPRKRGGKLCRQRSRLQMHAPRSIQVGPTPASLAEWRVAIPLLSPLDISTIPLTAEAEAAPPTEEEGRSPDGEKKEEVSRRWTAWQHPAAPFYYEPVPGNEPAFVVPRCT